MGQELGHELEVLAEEAKLAETKPSLMKAMDEAREKYISSIRRAIYRLECNDESMSKLQTNLQVIRQITRQEHEEMRRIVDNYSKY